MREIKFLGLAKHGNDKRNYQYSIFSCSFCGYEVVKKTKDGSKAVYCSHKCYALNRSARGSYNDYVIISGYKYLYRPEHPNKTKHNYVAEHRIVAEQKIGRLLKPNEDVHHIDFNKLNNHPNNLSVLTKSEHIRLHKTNKKRGEDGKFTNKV